MHLRLILLITLFLSAPLHVLAVEQPLYRFWSENYRSHFFTMSANEKDSIIANDTNWCYEGSAYYVESGQTTDTSPVYRFWSNAYKSHFFTQSTTEKDYLIANDANWSYEGIAYYVPKISTGNLPVYRFYSATYRSHFFTISEGEKNHIIANDPNWSYEGIAYYVSSNIPTSEDTSCGQTTGALGDIIRVGLWSTTPSNNEDDPIEIESLNKTMAVTDEDGNVIATVAKDIRVEVELVDDDEYEIDVDGTKYTIDDDVIFKAANEGEENDIILDVHQPGSEYDEYRTRIRVHQDSNTDLIWVINELPLEQYVWGIGEITATGPEEYNRAMTTIFRTYGFYKIDVSTEHKSKDFDTVPDPSDQIYRGHVWEERYPRIREAAEHTRGKMVYYDDEPILTPFSSWTDGRTRNYADGLFNGDCRDDDGTESSIFPYLIGVNDEWGEHPSLSTCELASSGNHMVGISANGALNLADDEGWDWDEIIDHYLTDVDIEQAY